MIRHIGQAERTSRVFVYGGPAASVEVHYWVWGSYEVRQRTARELKRAGDVRICVETGAVYEETSHENEATYTSG